VIIDEEVHEMSRASACEAECMERKNDFREVEFGFTKEQALEEAQRCLRCDIEIQTE